MIVLINCFRYVYAATHRDALAIIGRFNNFPFLNSTLRIGFTAGKKPLRDTEVGFSLPYHLLISPFSFYSTEPVCLSPCASVGLLVHHVYR